MAEQTIPTESVERVAGDGGAGGSGGSVTLVASGAIAALKAVWMRGRSEGLAAPAAIHTTATSLTRPRAAPAVTVGQAARPRCSG